MEGSGAGLATGAPAADAGQGADGAEGQDAAAQTPDLAAVLDKIGGQLEEQRQFLQNLPVAEQDDTSQETQEDEQTGIDPTDLSFLDESQPGYTPEGAIQQLGEFIEGLADKRAQALVAPLQKDIGELRTNAAVDDLVAKYPQMADPEIGKTVVDTAEQWAKSVGKPELGTMPEFYELVYLAGRAAEQGQQEDAAGGGSDVTLEGAGGASPGGAGQGDALTTESVTRNWRSSRHPLFTGGR